MPMKTARLNIRLSDDEYARIARAAQRVGQTVSSYVLSVVLWQVQLDDRVPEAPRIVRREDA